MVTKICGLCEKGQMQDAIRVLRKYRCGLMDSLHQSQSRVDCLDYLVYRMKKKLKEKESQS